MQRHINNALVETNYKPLTEETRLQ